jgi:parvulin-like peptidyl-prolyl isomerase
MSDQDHLEALPKMTSSQQDRVEEAPRDFTRYIWIGVGALVVIMVGAIFASGAYKPDISVVRARHILIAPGEGPADRQRSLELITEIKERLANGESFAGLAEEYSDDPYSAQRGGDLGYSRRGLYVPAFEKYCWTAPLNEVSDIISTEHGFHLVEVLDRQYAEADIYDAEVDRKAREMLGEDADPDAPNIEDAQ